MAADVLIIGLGAMGSAAAFHLARRGAKVIGLDQFRPPHPLGSSHGETRIIREAYFEDPAYVPLVQHAYKLWDALAQRSAVELFRQTGGLMIGPADGLVVDGSRRSAELHHLPHEVLSAAEVRSRFPALQPAEHMSAVWERRAGILFPERCIAAHLKCAEEEGAVLRYDERVLNWSAGGEGVEVETDSGRYNTAKLVISAGAWASSLVPELQRVLAVERQLQFWFQASTPEVFTNCPIHLWEHAPGRFFYGFPDLGGGVKIAVHHEGEVTTPDQVRREVSAEEVVQIQERVRLFLPALAGPLLRTAVCLYTNTPDGHFLMDFHPKFRNILVASPCSGHGFKFSSAIGSVVADLLLEGTTAFDLSLFRNRAT